MIGGGLLAVAGAGALAYGAYEPNCRLYGPVVGRGPRDRRVYLTFDDGPNGAITERILDLLDAARVPATFFMVGRHALRERPLAASVRARGHGIGNHTFSHMKLHRRGPRTIGDEISRAHDAIVDATGHAPRVFRAPHGYRNPFVGAAAARHGYRTFGWTYGVWDTDRPGADVIRRRMLRKLCPGAILLLHDGDGNRPDGDRAQTADALPGIIQDVRSAGYEFAPLESLV
jgi:peptidoglycan-N-acetylglucosamine deacetylase